MDVVLMKQFEDGTMLSAGKMLVLFSMCSRYVRR